MDARIKKMTLHGGPCDGDEFEIHEDTLKIKPKVSITTMTGEEVVYALDNDGKFVWLPHPDDPKVQRGIFVCDDDGNVLSEEKSIDDALRKLREAENEGTAL